MKVKEAMNKAVVIEADIKIRDAAKIMSERGIGSLIVMSKEKIVGIITDTDIMRNIDKLDSQISKIMSRNVVCIDAEESLDEVARLMAEKKIKRLPALKKEKLVGIITATDIIANSEELNEQFLFE